MLAFAEITSHPDAYQTPPQVPREEIQLLWHCDYWDGPRSGMVLYNGERYWFEVIAENEDEDFAGWYRRFAIIRLSAEQLAEEEHWHELFRENVGRHTDYVEGTRHLGDLRPREQWPIFYEAYRKRVPPDFSANEVVGWFEH